MKTLIVLLFIAVANSQSGLETQTQVFESQVECLAARAAIPGMIARYNEAREPAEKIEWYSAECSMMKDAPIGEAR